MSQPSPLTPALARAQSLVAAGDLAGARELLQRAVELGQAKLGDDDPDVLATQRELAAVHMQDDDPMKARRVLEEAYAAGQLRHGDESPLLLQISHDLGVVAEELGNKHEARKAFTRVAEHGPAVLGAQHWAVTRAQAYLGQDPANVRPQEPSPPPQDPEAAPLPPQRAQEQARQAAPGLENPTTRLPIIERRTPPVEPQTASPDTQAAPVTPAVPQQRSTPPTPVQGPRNRPEAQPEEMAPPTQQLTPATPQFPPATQQFPPATPQFPPATPQFPPATPQQSAVNAWADPRTVPPVAPPAYPDPRVPQQRGPQQPGPGWPTARQARPEASDVAPSPPAAYASQEAPRRRGMALFAMISAALAAVVAVAALVYVMADRESEKKPSLSGQPPADVALQDLKSSIDLSWRDPAFGSVSFMVTMARPGEQLKPVATVGPGTTQYRIEGLNAGLNYCFAVVAVYGTDKFASSTQVCTQRPAASGN